MFRDISDAMLARGYAYDLLFRNMPPYGMPLFDNRPARPKKRYLRRALAWSFERSGSLLTAAAARLRPGSKTPTLQGCG